MGSGIFGIGVSALSAAQAGLATTSHNIANANTPGFHRQTIVQSNANPLFSGAGFFGQGVAVDTVLRAYSEFLDTQVASAQAQASYYAAYQAQLSQIDNLLADAAAGLTPALQDFFRGVHEVAANPSSIPSRQALLAAGAMLVSRFQTIDTRLAELAQGVNTQLTAIVSSVNAYARQIANLNGRIAAAQVNPSQPPNDLLDQRDALIAELNQLVGATAVKQSDGSVNIFIGNGQNLVVGDQYFTLAVTPSLDDPRRLDLGYVVGGNTVRMNPGSLQGGSLGGLLAFRSDVLEPAQNELGRIAAGLAQSFNDQHRLGQDLNGALGADFFATPQPVVIDRATNGGDAVIAVAIADAGSLTASDYRLTYSGGSYQLTRLADQTTTTYAALPQTVDGFTLSLDSGAPADGDSFLIQPTRYAARDLAVAVTHPAEIAAAAPIRTAAGASNTGSATVSAGSVNGPPPPNANLTQPVTITFTSAGAFDVTGAGTGNPTGVAYVAGTDISYNGWTIQIVGTPAAGDTFTVTANSGGVADNRNALLLAGLQTRNTLAQATTSYQGAYSQIVSEVGNKAREIEIASAAQDNLAAQARQSQQSLSGVNLDEEAANLMRYQQAYQAAGKMIQVAAALFETVLDLAD